MAASYPNEPFAQAENLLTGLIDSYKGARDAADLADIQSMVENAVKAAQDREFRVQDSIKGACWFVCVLPVVAGQAPFTRTQPTPAYMCMPLSFCWLLLQS